MQNMDRFLSRLENDSKTLDMCNTLFSAFYNGDEVINGVSFEIVLANISSAPIGRRICFLIQEILYWDLFPRLTEENTEENLVLFDKIFCSLQLYESLRYPFRKSFFLEQSVEEKKKLIETAQATFKQWYNTYDI